jgi:hypothetical protein
MNKVANSERQKSLAAFDKKALKIGIVRFIETINVLTTLNYKYLFTVFWIG